MSNIDPNAVAFLVTHSGSFHADDVLSYAVLAALFPEAKLLRVRNQGIIDALKRTAIVFDVGGTYDVEARRFDHHQVDKPRRPSGMPYSSFGLIWKTYGMDYLEVAVPDVTNDMRAQLHERIDAKVVRDIDAGDNGTLERGQEGLTHSLSFANMVASFNAPFDAGVTAADQINLFKVTSAYAKVFLDARIHDLHAQIRAKNVIKDAMENRSHPNWMELPLNMKFHDAVFESGDTDLQFVLSPDRSGEWNLECVRAIRGNFTNRKDMPAEWAGLRDAELAAVSGVPDAVFCHTGRFFAVAKSREGALALLAQCLDQKH